MGRVWPRHGHYGRPLNSAVRFHANVDAKPIGKFTIALFGVGLVLVVVVSLDQPGGPVREVHGVVLSVAVEHRDMAPSSQMAAITLPDGSKVSARVVTSALVKPGQAVRLNEYRGPMTGRKTYEVIATEGGT